VTLPALIALKPRQRHKTDLDSDSDSDSEILVSYVNNMRSAVVDVLLLLLLLLLTWLTQQAAINELFSVQCQLMRIRCVCVCPFVGTAGARSQQTNRQTQNIQTSRQTDKYGTLLLFTF